MVNDPRADDARLPVRKLTDVDIHTTTVPAGGEQPNTDQEQLNEFADSLEADEPVAPKPPLGPQPLPGNSLEPAPVRPFEDSVIFDFLPLTPAQGSHIPKDLMPEFMRRLMGGLAKGEEAGKDRMDMLTEGHEDYIVDKVRAPYYQINRHQLMMERAEGAKHIRQIARADNIPEMEIWRLVRDSQQLAQDQRLTQDEAFEQIGGPAKMAEMKAAGAAPVESQPRSSEGNAPPAAPEKAPPKSDDGGTKKEKSATPPPPGPRDPELVKIEEEKAAELAQEALDFAKTLDGEIGKLQDKEGELSELDEGKIEQLESLKQDLSGLSGQAKTIEQLNNAYREETARINEELNGSKERLEEIDRDRKNIRDHLRNPDTLTKEGVRQLRNEREKLVRERPSVAKKIKDLEKEKGFAYDLKEHRINAAIKVLGGVRVTEREMIDFDAKKKLPAEKQKEIDDGKAPPPTKTRTAMEDAQLQVREVLRANNLDELFRARARARRAEASLEAFKDGFLH